MQYAAPAAKLGLNCPAAIAIVIVETTPQRAAGGRGRPHTALLQKASGRAVLKPLNDPHGEGNMKHILVLAIALGVAGFCLGDQILFTDMIELGGPNVEILSRNAQKIEVKVKYGVVSFNTDRIKKISIEFKDRMKKLIEKGDDTPKNLFDLAALCDQCGMTKEAAQSYAYILRKPNVPEEMMKRLAGICEKMQLWPEAKTAYEKLLLTNPADADLQARSAACAE